MKVVKVKSVNCSFSLNLYLRGFSVICQTFPAFIFTITYRSAGFMFHRGRPGGWSRYPKREWALGRYVLSVSSGEFNQPEEAEFPTELDV